MMAVRNSGSTWQRVVWRVCLLLVSGLVFAAPAHAATYGYAPTTFSWINPASHTPVTWSNTSLCTGGGASVDDDITAPINIGFNFTYGTTTYSQVQVMSNGRLQFNNNYCYYGTLTVGPPPTYPLPYPDPNLANTMRVYGADFCPAGAGSAGCGGTVTYASLGTAPNRYFVVTWSQMREWNSGTSLFNVQMILYENGNFVYQYKDIANVTQGAAQIGWELTTSDYGVVDEASINSLAYTALMFYKPTPPLLEYRFDACTGSSVTDSSGNGYTGTITNSGSGGTVTQGAPGIICSSANFSGGYVSVPASFPNLTSGLSITAWFKPTNVSNAGQRIFADDENNTGGYAVSLGDGGTGMVRFYSRAVNPIILDSAAVVTANNWYFVAAVADTNAQTMTLSVYDAAGNLLSSKTQSWTGTWGVDSGVASVGGETNLSAESAYRFIGNIDELKVYNRPLAATEVASIYSNESQGLNRDGTLRYCTPCNVTLGSFNAFESSTPAGSISGVLKTKIAGEAFSASTGDITLVALNAARTAINTGYNANNVRVDFLDASAETGSPDANGCYASDTTVIATTGNQNMVNGVVTISPSPNLSNAYKAVRLRVYAPPGNPTSIGCSNDVFAIRPAYFSVPAATSQDSNWQTAGGSRSLTNVAASGGNVHAAGMPFSLSGLTAINAANGTTTNYTGTPSLVPGNLVLPDPTYCGNNGYNCLPGAFNVTAWTYTNGVLSSTTASYSEAGSFSWQVEDQHFADVDKYDSTKLQRYIESNAVIYTGRFVPASYKLVLTTPSLQTFGSGCASRSFTYLGQPFGYSADPVVGITPMNGASTPVQTKNYLGVVGSGGLWKLATPLAYSSATCTAPTQTCAMLRQDVGGKTQFGATYSYVPIPATSLPGWASLNTALVDSAVLTNNNNGSGTLVFGTTDQLAMARPAAPLAPMTAVVALALSLADTSEAGTAGNPASITGSLAATPINFDSGNQFLYGQLKIGSAYGSELMSLAVPLESQFWNGTVYTTNAADNCTVVPASSIIMNNYQLNLSACKTYLNPSTSIGLTGGRANLHLTAPGLNNIGSVNLAPNIGVTASGNTCLSSTQSAATAGNLPWFGSSNPLGRETFGLRKTPVIYLRENF